MKEYLKGRLSYGDCPSNPVDLFLLWLDEAVKESASEASMVLSTVDKKNRPSSRIVLLKGLDQNGLRFFSNYNSRKGVEIETNPFAAANFFWPELERQIRVNGIVERLSSRESDDYFDSRSEESRINALISPQSKVIPNRDFLIKRQLELKNDFASGLKKIIRPDNWGGYLLKPNEIEFWQGRAGRLNDRILYSLEKNTWKKRILAP